MEKDKLQPEEKKFGYFGTFRKIALMFFLGFSLYITVSAIMLIFLTKSEKEIKLPDVVGKRFIDVHNKLIRSGIKPVLKFKEVFEMDDGIILSQHPGYGSIVTENSNLKLVISRSKINIETPNLVGIELPVAINKLKNLHSHGKAISISSGIISYIPSEKNADNIVIGQNPKAGEMITPDRKINLLVSTGNLRSDNRMPDLRGQSIDLCYDLLLSKNVRIEEEIVETSNIKKSGIIISQKPGKGSRLKKGSSVKLKIYWYPVKEHPYMAYEKVEYTIPDDQKAGLFEVLIEDHVSKRTRFSDNMKPGEKISFIFHRVGNAKISIMNNKQTIRIMSIDVEEYR